jgi:hypothetical protein
VAVPLPLDRDLTTRDVQGLANGDAVATFFTSLGYDTSARLRQTTAAMGITAESVRTKVQRIERIASEENGTLEVYLIELDSVTFAATRGLARALRDRAGNYLLVLTDDFDTLDFVLLEREIPEISPVTISAPRVSVRARTLTVARRNPNVVALRVLRRFTYTEADADAQYDKLRSAYVVAEWSETNFNNHALFADYFLNVRLRDLPEWSEDPKPSFLRLRELFRQARERFAGADDATAHRDLVEPALRILGFALARSPTAEAAPDYLLQPESGNGAAIAGLAYTWDRSLDGKDEKRDARRPDDNPGARVVSVRRGRYPLGYRNQREALAALCGRLRLPGNQLLRGRSRRDAGIGRS